MYEKVIKRFFDIVLSLIGIIITGPLMLVMAILIKLDSNGPAIFKQVRLGKDKKTFTMYKFRSMLVNTPNIPTYEFKDSQKYITKIGKFMRNTSIDELPQLFNILKGDMSLIGIRPPLWDEYGLINDRDIYGINSVKPGLSGWAQINGRDYITQKQKALFDKEYMENISFLFDLKILARTCLQVIKCDGIFEGVLADEDKEIIEKRPQKLKKAG